MHYPIRQWRRLIRLNLLALATLIATAAILAILNNASELEAQSPRTAYQVTGPKVQQSATHRWTTETVNTDCGWSPSIMLDQYQEPHIAYGCGYAVMSGTQWIKEPAGIEGDVSLVLDGVDLPHISFGNGSLGYAYSNGTNWTVETVESYVGDGLGRNSAIALDASGHPHITYYGPQPDPNPTDFRHAYYDGSRWITQTIAGDARGNGTGVSSGLVIDSKGDLHTLYYKEWNDIAYAHSDGNSWNTQVIAYGHGGSLAMASDGSLHVSFVNGYALQYATLMGSEWIVQDVVPVDVTHSGMSPMGFGNPGATAIQIDTLGMPHIAFHYGYDEGTPLFYAYFNGSEWLTETIDSQGTPGYGRLSLTLDPSGYPHIAYYSGWTDDELRYAYMERPSIVVSPSAGATLIHTGTQSLQTAVQIPGGAVTEPIEIVFTERDYARGIPAGFAFAGQGFQFEAYRSNGMHILDYGFKKSITITVEYSDVDIAVVSDESALELRCWNGGVWDTNGITVIEHDVDNNRLVATITHLSQFAMFGATHQIYLPLVVRN